MYADIEIQKNYQKKWEEINRENRTHQRRIQRMMEKIGAKKYPRHFIKIIDCMKRIEKRIESKGSWSRIPVKDLYEETLPNYAISKKLENTMKRNFVNALDDLEIDNKIFRFNGFTKTRSGSWKLVNYIVFNQDPNSVEIEYNSYNTMDLLDEEEKYIYSHIELKHYIEEMFKKVIKKFGKKCEETGWILKYLKENNNPHMDLIENHLDYFYETFNDLFREWQENIMKKEKLVKLISKIVINNHNKEIYGIVEILREKYPEYSKFIRDNRDFVIKNYNEARDRMLEASSVLGEALSF